MFIISPILLYMKEALLHTQREVPFNNFSNILEEAKEDVPPGLGGDCVVQADHLEKGLKERGYTPRRVRAVNSRHVALVCNSEEGEPYYLDPFLLHDDPISLGQAFGERSMVEVGAKPVVSGRPTKVIIRGMELDCFEVASLGYREGEGEYLPSWRALYSLRQSGIDDGSKPWGVPTLITLRVAEDAGGVLNIKKKVGSSQNEFFIGRVGERHVKVTELDANEEARKYMDAISRAVKVEAKSVLEKIQIAVDICMIKLGA